MIIKVQWKPKYIFLFEEMKLTYSTNSHELISEGQKYRLSIEPQYLILKGDTRCNSVSSAVMA